MNFDFIEGWYHEVRFRRTGGIWRQSHRAIGSEFTIIGLANSTEYELQVRARESSDGGEWTYAESAWGRPGPLQFVAPDNLLIYRTGSDWIRIRWRDSRRIDTQKVNYRLAGATAWVEIDVGLTYAKTIGGFEPNTSYEFRVGSFRGNEPSKWSKIITGTTDTTAPTNVSVAAADGELTVTWTGGTNADSHQVRWRTAAGDNVETGEWWEATPTTTGSHTIEGLTNDTAYDVEVGAAVDALDWWERTRPTKWSDTVQGTPEEARTGRQTAPEEEEESTPACEEDASTACLHDGRFKVTATSSTKVIPVYRRHTHNWSVDFKLPSRQKVLYVGIASYCHLNPGHMTYDSSSYGDNATYVVTVEDLEGNVIATYSRDGSRRTGTPETRARSHVPITDSETFRCLD